MKDRKPPKASIAVLYRVIYALERWQRKYAVHDRASWAQAAKNDLGRLLRELEERLGQ